MQAGREAELMARYCDGDAAAFYELYGLVAPRLCSYLRALLGDRAAADDVLQLTFLKLHRARSAYVRGADPVPWLYAIGYRSAMDELRRRKREREQQGRLAGEAAVADGDRAGLDGRHEDAAELGAHAPLVTAALAALDALPESQRAALVMTKLEGRSIGEAALLAQTTPGAIKLRVHRGYTTLRRLLGRSRPPEEDE